MTTWRRCALPLLALTVVATAATVVTWSIRRSDEPSKPSSHVALCRQAQLQPAIEQGGGFQTGYASGYTFLILNVGPNACELRGYPYEIIFSTVGGESFKVTTTHQPTTMFAQPEARRVVLAPLGVASFGISYVNVQTVPSTVTPDCLARYVDFRLPARSSSLYSEEFAVNIDLCAIGHRAEVTPVEGRSIPLA